MKVTLVSSTYGLYDVDITGAGTIRRATIGHSMKKGDVFNIYHGEGAKSGGIWLGRGRGLPPNIDCLVRSIEASEVYRSQAGMPEAPETGQQIVEYTVHETHEFTREVRYRARIDTGADPTASYQDRDCGLSEMADVIGSRVLTETIRDESLVSADVVGG